MSPPTSVSRLQLYWKLLPCWCWENAQIGGEESSTEAFNFSKQPTLPNQGPEDISHQALREPSRLVAGHQRYSSKVYPY